MVANIHSTDREHVRRVKSARVWLNDEEVTSRSFYADDVAGIVRCYQLDANGHKYFDHSLGGVPMIERKGRVRIELPR